MTQWERMGTGELYNAGDPELQNARDRAKRLTWRYNQIDPTDWDGRTELLRELLGRLIAQAHQDRENRGISVYGDLNPY